jgi:hypothetical protein
MPTVKNRRADGHVFWIDTWKRTKAEAQTEAKKLRGKGYKVRIFPTSSGYDIGVRH